MSTDPAGWSTEVMGLVDALRRLAVADEMAGLGDVEDAEGLARIEFARRALSKAGLPHKRGSP